MKYLAAKITITLACAIILLHAVVPHHHHDCADEVGLIFETEINCHCSHHQHTHDCDNDCHNHHSDHPFDMCRLADMLSHLVLSSKEDESLMAQAIKAEVHDLLLSIMPATETALLITDNDRCHSVGAGVPWAIPLPPLVGGHSLRAPPMCA